MSERQMTIILLVVMGATIVLGGVALYWLRFVELDELEVQLADVSKKRAEAQAKKAAIKGLEDKVKSLKEGIARIQQQIPIFNPKEENDRFADLVDMLRKKCQVQISGARFSAAKAGGPGEAIPDSIFQARYEMKVSGGFYQLLNFLNHLETERRFLVADSIKLVAGGTAEKRGLAPVRELQLNLSTYLQRMPPPPPTAPVATKPTDKPAETPEEMRRLSTPVPD